eukprot:CAMPEP_0115027646 /NCGR_PEP_ID=MMETSP0216-20121206/35689_1 /TAXON_ID=223996 /ORGANISM="Protocruzia adherens, Strain Boccale" /LENGTH=104 /DNA_ID=CAMNT_0002403399 /DNA_START=8 /DNA_END=318 /DNA_ORIENTATION=+
MVKHLLSITKDFQSDPNQKALLYHGKGRAFCSGSDLLQGLDIDSITLSQYYHLALTLNYLNCQHQKPFIVIWDGISMGNGLGISHGASHKIVTERLSFAMPECR